MKYEIDKHPLEQYRRLGTAKVRAQLKELAKYPEFISGIYNYCDRWCERCPFTSRCMNFAFGEEQFPNPETRDVNNEAFWRRLTETFQITLDLIEERAAQEGIELNVLDIEEVMAEEDRLMDEAENHEICLAAKAYGKMVDEWFDFFENQEDELNFKWHAEISEEANLEVIRWYQHQIHIKLMRAVTGSLEEVPEILKDYPKDSDGSAKVALISIDRSMSAWDKLWKNFPKQEAKILNLIFHLERLRRNVEDAFPNARAFVRPGFDE